MTIHVPAPQPVPLIDLDPVAAEVRKAVWLLGRLSPGARPALCRSYWVDGPLDLDALRAAWHLVLEGHAALRTTEGTTTTASSVGPAHPDSFAVHGHDAAPTASNDLDTGPPAQLTVYPVTARHHRVVLSAHLAVADPTSMSVLAADLSTAYAETAGITPVPAATPPPIPALEAGALASAGEVAFDWGPDLGRALRDLALREGSTVDTVLLAACHVVLARHSEDDGVTIAVADDLRKPGQERLVGPLTTLSAVDGRFGDAGTFRAYLRQMARRRHDARRLRPSSVRWRVRADGPEHGGTPCATVLAVAVPAPLRLAGTAVLALPSPVRALPVDLLLTVGSTSRTLTGTVASPADRIGRRWIEGVLGQLRTLLTVALRDPDLPLADLPLEDAAQQAAMVRAADATVVPTPRPVTELVHQCARRFPDAVAVRDETGNLTYAELAAEVSALAAWLNAQVSVTGHAVALRLPMGPALVRASLAVLHAGGHVTWLDPTGAGEQARALLVDLCPAVLLIGDGETGEPLAEWFRIVRGGPVLVTGSAPLSPAAPRTPAPAAPTTAAYVSFTAGSTGRPKGVVQTHAALAQFALWLARTAQLRPGARVAQWAAVTHDPALCEVFAALTCGATLVPVPQRVRVHPERFVRWLDREGITMVQIVPSFAREVVGVIERDGSVPARLAHLFLMGEALTVRLANRLRQALTGVRLWNLYGPTETVAASVYEIVAPVRGERVPIGRSIPGRQVLIVDGRGRHCPAGMPGEILVRSRYAGPAYLPTAAGTDDAPFRALPGLPPTADPAAGCYRTGDLGRRRFDGELEYLGRRDHQVKLAGYRLELAAVEAGLAEHPLVADCAVSPVTDPDSLVSRLVAFVVLRADAEPSVVVRELRALLRRHQGPVRHRTSFVSLDRIPRNPAGKVDRARLPDPRTLADAPGRAGSSGRPRRTEDEHG
ncbi:AMP-binding protein [Micromonospora sp. LOL_024]|uniref:AMP-binding protein n=1 Tax=Micromonospora sp. LOL_024 TaxID=3345412 RepID=UPI003A8435B9